MAKTSNTRIEKDSMGEMTVDANALYGASTQRAVLNFPVSGQTMPHRFIRAAGLLKFACAQANEEIGRLPADKAELIRKAALEVCEGRHAGHFPVDIFQTGSCTSTNMNVNEVIANRVSQLAGEPLGSRRPVHPNDDVNLGQSSNDTMPTTLHLSVATALNDDLAPALEHLESTLVAKAEAWADVVKIGRTHLMDATPLTLGQEFSGYAAQTRQARARIGRAINALLELAIGGTAVGTGINCHPDFASRVVRILIEKTQLPFRIAENHFESQGGRDACVEVAGQLNAVAASLTKIANDIRLLGSGPRSGLGEISLPATQPGSSIMPGKVNPVMCEMLVQVGIHTMGMGTMVNLCGRDGHFELNVTIPLLAHTLLKSIECMANGSRLFADRCVSGLEANRERCDELVRHSLMLVTALNPHIGYDKAAEVAKKAHAENKSLRDTVLELGLMDAETLDKALDPMAMTKPKI